MSKASAQKILVVDDTAANRKQLTEVLHPQYGVIPAKSTQAFNKAVQHQPDLILMDMLMPALNGFELLRALKADERTAAIGVIFITGQGTPEDEERCLLNGASDYIVKPFHASVVRARVALHLQLARQRRMLEALANVDGLTEIPNRRQFDTTFANEWARALRSGQPLSIALLDVDYFKQYNDNYGHAMGDRVLQAVASALRTGMKRHGDLAARYGGEEFILVMPDTRSQGAFELANSMRQAIEGLRIPHEFSKAGSWITVSAGVACNQTDLPASRDALLKLSDERLYMAKNAGRNMVVGNST